MIKYGRKKIPGILLLVCLISGCVSVDPHGRGYSVAIPMEVVSSTLAEQFPVQEKRSMGVIKVSDPVVLGQYGQDKLGLGTSFTFTNWIIPKGIGGKLKLASGVRFDTTTQNLYLASPMVEELVFMDFSLAQYLTKDMKNTIGLIIAEIVGKVPIYNLKKLGRGAAFINGIAIRNGQLYVTFGL